MSQATWTKVPERGSMWTMRLGMAVMNLLGYRIGLIIGFFATLYFFVTGPASRRASREYLSQLHQWNPQAPKPTLANVFKHHWHFGSALVDRLWFWQGKMDAFQFTDEGKEHLINRQSGVLLMGAHVGSFDALRAFSHDKNLRLNVVMYRGNAQKINQLLKTLNPEANVQIIELDSGSVDQVFALKDKLADGEIVAVLGDRPAPHGRQRLSYRDFLGKTAPFPQNPWILASLLECPVMMVTGLRVAPKRYHICVRPMTERVVLPRKTRMESLESYLTGYIERLEEVCRDHPFQWFNFYPFWRSDDPSD